jgi:hypothetical protein
MRLIVVVKHTVRRLKLVRQTLARIEDLFDVCDLIPPKRFMSLMRSSSKDDFNGVRVWFFDSVTDINKVTKTELFWEFYALIDVLRIQTSPTNLQTMQHFERKEYARDCKHLMLPGTVVFDGSEAVENAWEKVLCQHSVRMKSGLMNGGGGQCVVRGFDEFKKYFRKQFDVEGARGTKVVLCQRNINPFLETHFIILPDYTILSGGIEVPPHTKTLIQQLVPILFKHSGGVAEFPWRLDLVKWKGKFYLNEAEYCPAGAGMWLWVGNDVMSESLAACFRASLPSNTE